ncbi:hypothetical protein L917_07113 [Phytophthora nicotianae]|uniref:Uncharacterized protein n=1 Tax=Phytophthora nicotianae TaxID=4792 RepID=W2LE62_PHYNI|nr:hypothetical protein L917_07113 [Phytophthora nicotianae]
MKEVVPKATRTKTAGTLREKEYKKGKVLRSVVCRLNRMCADKRLVKEIKCTALAMKPIQMETWHLVNLHTLHSLKHDLPLPDYGKTFFDHCGLHTQAGLREGANMTGFSELKQALRQQLVVNAGVMTREQFRKRLRAYVLIKFGKTGDDLSPAK